jgi:hypothetical protein
MSASKGDTHAPVGERLWRRVRLTDPEGCWEWLGGTTRGYGLIYDGVKRYVKAHRVAYEVAVGPIPDGLIVCHACDNRLCCNPDHLWIGTQRDNVWDAIRKGRR